MDKLHIRAKYEKTSIQISNGIINTGTPVGKNKWKIWSPCFKQPMILTPMKKLKEKNKVIIYIDVIVILKGSNPKKLLNNRNQKIK